MIFSSIHESDAFSAYAEPIRRVLDFYRTTDVMNLSAGRIELDGERIFINVMTAALRPIEGSFPEVHKRYIDVFYWPEGGELLGVSHYTGREKLHEERPGDDISFVESPENESFLRAKAGDFAVLFPWDAHRPGIELEGMPKTFRKCVAKIAVELLDKE